MRLLRRPFLSFRQAAVSTGCSPQAFHYSSDTLIFYMMYLNADKSQFYLHFIPFLTTVSPRVTTEHGVMKSACAC